MNNYKLYDAKYFYKEGLIPSKDNKEYLNFLDNLHTRFPEVNVMGIYGIRYNGRLAYIGKSTDICNRWIAHVWNATCPTSKEYNRAMYIVLRHMLELGKVEYEIEETTEDVTKLAYLEAYYINRLMPLLNKQVPKLNDGFLDLFHDDIFKLIVPDSVDASAAMLCDFDACRNDKEKLHYIDAYYVNKYGTYPIKHLTKLRDEPKSLISRDIIRVMPEITRAEYSAILDDLAKNRSFRRACQERPCKPRAGENNPMWGRHHSEETKEKMRAASSGGNNPSAKSVRCVETDTIYPTIKEAGLHNGIAPTSISQCCKGNQQTAGGYHWEYVEKK